MTDLLIILIALSLNALGCFALGYRCAQWREVHSISKYVRSFWPDAYQAYHQGIDEGYAQGFRDARLNATEEDA